MTIFARIEALLFYYGEPIAIKKLASLLGISEEECAQALNDWEKTLAENGERGLLLLRKGESIQLATKPELKSLGEAIVKDEFREQLTPASIEVLSLVAYLGPMPRATIDYIRGVNSSFTLRSLVMRGLIERGDEKGNSFHYRITEEFLKHMGIASIQTLPEYEKYRTILREFEAQIMQPTPTTETVATPHEATETTSTIENHEPNSPEA
ncbi:MAG: SMC-Scp complex subunit ScpB [Candidatus Paceibacterota bacterium]|jgi:segregation and condensation protein B